MSSLFTDQAIARNRSLGPVLASRALRQVCDGIVGTTSIHNIRLNCRIVILVRAPGRTNAAVPVRSLSLASSNIHALHHSVEQSQSSLWLVEWDLMTRIVDPCERVLAGLLNDTVDFGAVGSGCG